MTECSVGDINTVKPRLSFVLKCCFGATLALSSLMTSVLNVLDVSSDGGRYLANLSLLDSVVSRIHPF